MFRIGSKARGAAGIAKIVSLSVMLMTSGGVFGVDGHAANGIDNLSHGVVPFQLDAEGADEDAREVLQRIIAFCRNNPSSYVSCKFRRSVRGDLSVLAAPDAIVHQRCWR